MRLLPNGEGGIEMRPPRQGEVNIEYLARVIPDGELCGKCDMCVNGICELYGDPCGEYKPDSCFMDKALNKEKRIMKKRNEGESENG